MYISKIKMKNFRLLNDTSLDLKKDLSLLIGRNNSGKTSFLVLFEKFYEQKDFNYNDFSLSLRNKIKDINDHTETNQLTIQMVLEIKYHKDDNLEHISDFILDLDPEIDTVKILFECAINKKSLLKDLLTIESEDKERYIIKNINSYLQKDVYVFDDYKDLEINNRHKLVKKELKSIKKLINFQIIHAKRDVASSEENKESKKVLSSLTTKYFNNNSQGDFISINKQLIEMDSNLDKQYDTFFKTFLKNSKEFLEIKNIKVVSNLQSNELLQYSSQVVYGVDNNHLPENLNGLGFMNILYLLLTIEIKKENFIDINKEINLLFIEEPEAHTHPQMQYVFARKIKTILDDVKNLQTVVTTHSAQIVSQCDFEDIRYLMKTVDEDGNENTEIKNFHTELEKKYTKLEEFKFLKQYLTIQSAELFFASKIIFIEGTTEKILLPYFINKFDKENEKKESYIPLSSQNICILEVGANAKVFHHFLEFLKIKTLIITDIDTTAKMSSDKGYYSACEVLKAQNTSNETLKHFLRAPDLKTEKPAFEKWIENLRTNALDDYSENIKIAYQTKEKNYQGRSFEDAFININKETIKMNKDNIDGLKKTKLFEEEENIYELTQEVLDKKSNFAASLLYLALSEEAIDWEIPAYIRGGLSWIAE
ncbi:hypothetical protein ASG99_16740 [Bacillus sp. Soil768D1]|nr:hypothetical protein ASG99_16740 [Bacillus sp. Soil768D1]